MSNSPLVTYTRISPNQSSRLGNKIDTITIHHMAGNLSVETVGRVFSDGYREASANYAIDNDLQVGMYVEEKDRSWASSNGDNDRRAVTIELANDEIGGQWHVADKVIAKCIDLVVDICQRNGIKKLNYTGDTSGNLTKHCWFAATLCPGPYLGSKFDYIADQVNLRLDPPKPTPKPVMGFERVWGNNRFETAKALANVTYPGKFRTAVLASGENYADALSAGYLTSRVGGPLLLVNNTTSVMNSVATYLKGRLEPEAKIYICGGKGVIPEEMEKLLADWEIKRYAGKNRYLTNLEIFKSVEIGSAIAVCSGKNFPDALCASTLQIPILLVGDKLLKEQIEFLGEIDTYYGKMDRTYYIIGGASAVNEGIEKELQKFGKTSRCYGSNRYGTSAAIAKRFFAKADTIMIATGKNFPDGLCSCNLGRYPLLLADENAYQEAQGYVTTLNPKKAYVIGGTGSVSNETADWVLTKK